MEPKNTPIQSEIENHSLTFAIFGAGNMGQRLARSLQRVPGVSIRYVFSRTIANAQKLAQACGAEAVDKPDRIFSDNEVDGIIDCLPTFTRLETLRPAVASGKHIFCEKPLALNSEMAKQIRGLLHGYARKIMVGQVLRFFWEYVTLREKVLSGEVGHVGIVRLSRCVGFPGADSWFADPAKSGGVILDLLIHDLDFLLWTFGEVQQVFAKSLTDKCPGKLDYALLNIQLKSGALAHIEGSWAHPVGSFHQSVEICGSRGMLAYDNLNCSPLKWVSTAEPRGEPGSRISLPETDASHDPYSAEIEHFIDCIRTDRQPSVSYEEALKSCELAFLAIESARQGVPLTNPV